MDGCCSWQEQHTQICGCEKVATSADVLNSTEEVTEAFHNMYGKSQLHDVNYDQYTVFRDE